MCLTLWTLKGLSLIFLFELSAMIDNFGSSGKVNNLLSTLNVGRTTRRSLQAVEERAACFLESVAKQSIESMAKQAFTEEMGYD